jgi:alpha-glucosidase
VRARIRLLSSIALLLLIVRPAAADWTTVRRMPAPRQEPAGLIFRDGQVIVAITAVTPEIIRVRFSPTPTLGRDHSYAVVPRSANAAAPRISVGRTSSAIRTSALTVTVVHEPFRVSFEDAHGASLDRDDDEHGMTWSGSAVRAWKRLRDDEHVYGFGEKTGRLDKRGRKLGGYSYAMWNSDTFAYESDTDPIYAAIPFFMVLRNGTAHGIFLDNTFRSSFDVGHESYGRLAFGADGGELNYYFIYGPTPKQVVARYAELTGHMPLPPLWALGYHQCRYSYYPDSEVRFIAENFRARHIPADVIWLDIHYQDGYKPFTWDRRRFPDPARLVSDLGARGFQLVTIVDPHPKKESGYPPYDSGTAGNHFVRGPDSAIVEAPVWPSLAEERPGPSVFPDFSRSATREWWGGLYKSLTDVGVAGIWNDMNEPATFVEPSGTLPLDARHDNEGQPTDHREVHNVYGQLMSRSSYEGLMRLRPDARPFVLTRATFAGGQRYAAVWPGDNISTWTHLRATLPILMGLGLSGFPFVGSDIGGFAGAPSAELYTRWLQAGVFYPFMRSHTVLGTPPQDPWSYGARHEAINRRAIELRYELLPTIYNVMRDASVTGLPAMRPLVLEYPDDAQTYGADDEFLFGSDLLIAPVLDESATERGVYLPAGRWYDFWTGAPVDGGRSIQVPVTLESLPIYVRAGAFVFRQPVVQHTGEMRGQPLRVMILPAEQSTASLYEDDGSSMKYRQGEYAIRQFTQQRSADSVRLAVSAYEGRFRPEPRTLELWVRDDAPPSRVQLADGGELPRLEAAAWNAAGTGWMLDGAYVKVKLPDPRDAVSIVLRH